MGFELTPNSVNFDPMFSDLKDFPADGVFFRVFNRNVAELHLRAKINTIF